MLLTFDEYSHTYWIDGVRVPSVTQIIKAAGIGYCHDRTDPMYSVRGKAVHRAVELVDKGDLDDSSLDPRVLPYFQAYLKFQKDTGYKPLYSELRLGHAELMFAGTLDSVGCINRRLGGIEIKCTQSVDAKALQAQICGQEALWNHNNPKRPWRFKYGLQLRPNGKPNLITKFSDTPTHHWLDILEQVKDSA